MKNDQLIIASNNQGKIKEIMELLPGMQLRSMRDIGFVEEIPEPYHTFAENAAAKARTIYMHCGCSTFADDSGICVPALDDAPGVRSARYAGDNADDGDNLRKLIQEMTAIEDRRAYYKAVICLVWNDKEYFFEGTCHGTLAKAPAGKGGFGYDPVFIPDGHTETFGQLPPEVKNKLSHRGEAVRKMVDFIKEQEG